jgi:uncharacterized caspase-like protein
LYRKAPELKNAVNDASAIAAALEARSFNVTLYTDLDLAKMRMAIERFLVQIQPGDVALFYYSGHGLQIANENYLIPTDFAATYDTSLRDDAYPLSRVIDRLAAARTRMSIVILDACRNNPFSTTRSISRGWAPVVAGTGTYVAFATAPGSVASDNSNASNGLFTQYLLKALSLPNLGIDQVFQTVRQDVFEASDHAQLPWTESSIIGDFIFTPSSTAAGANGPSPDPGTPSVRELLARKKAQRSLAAMTKDLESDPKNVAGYILRAEQFVRMGDFAAAHADLNKALSINAACEEALRERGRVSLLQAEYSKAVNDLSAAIALNPEDIGALHFRSIAYEAGGQYDAAIQDATEIIRSAPIFAEAYVTRCGAYAAASRFRDALDDCTRAIDLDPTLSIAYALRGSVFRGLGNFASARSDFTQATSMTRRNDTRQR